MGAALAEALGEVVALEPAVDAGLGDLHALHVEDGFGAGAGFAAVGDDFGEVSVGAKHLGLSVMEARSRRVGAVSREAIQSLRALRSTPAFGRAEAPSARLFMARLKLKPCPSGWLAGGLWRRANI